MGSSWLILRYIILALAVTSTCVDYLSRSNITMAIIAMVDYDIGNQTTDSNNNATKHEENFSCPLPTTTNSGTNETQTHRRKPLPGPKYDWNPKMQGISKTTFNFSVLIIAQFQQVSFLDLFSIHLS